MPTSPSSGSSAPPASALAPQQPPEHVRCRPRPRPARSSRSAAPEERGADQIGLALAVRARSRAAARRSRTSSPGMRSGAIARPAEAAACGGMRVRAGATVPSKAAAERRRELAADRAGALAQQVPDRAQHRERHQREPVEEQCAAGRVGHAAVQLRGAADPGASARGERAAAAEVLGPRAAADPGAGDPDDPAAGQAGADREVEAGIRRSAGPDRSRRALPRARGARASPDAVTPSTSPSGVVLRLVEFAVDELHRRAEARDALAVRAEQGAIVGVDQLRAGDRDRRRDLDGGEQPFEGSRFGGGVGGEQPEPVVARLAGCRASASAVPRCAEPEASPAERESRTGSGPAAVRRAALAVASRRQSTSTTSSGRSRLAARAARVRSSQRPRRCARRGSR